MPGLNQPAQTVWAPSQPQHPSVYLVPPITKNRNHKRKNHKWHGNICLNCEVQREKRSEKILMAIHKGKNIYTYESKYMYIMGGKESFKRPICWDTITFSFNI